MAHIDKAHSTSTKINPSSGNLKWMNDGYKPELGLWEIQVQDCLPAWLFSALWQTSPLFDRKKAFLAIGLIFHNKKKKMCFLQSPVIRAPTLLDRSYSHWHKTSQTSWRLSFLLMSLVVRQRLRNKGINCMGLNRLLNMTTIFMTFCLT